MISMRNIKHSNKFLKLLIGFSFLTLLSACSSQTNKSPSDTDVLATTMAANPLPTQLVGQNLQIVSQQACMVKDFVTINTEEPQGDLISWSPVNNALAFLRPENQSWSWYIGDLVVYDPKQDNEILATQSQAVFGDLTWSPDGSSLAYIVLDQTTDTYTIRMAGLNDNTNIDIFGVNQPARTDNESSKKGIRGWSSPNILILVSSCGQDCMTVFDFSKAAKSLTQQGNVRKSDDKSLTFVNEDTSPDGKWQITIDEVDNIWFTSKNDGQVSLLLTATPVNEIKWSADSSYFALRTAERVLIYEPECSIK
jgi:dipeptidyl aminopeptidase/acylaminoacyl peptidase